MRHLPQIARVKTRHPPSFLNRLFDLGSLDWSDVDEYVRRDATSGIDGRQSTSDIEGGDGSEMGNGRWDGAVGCRGNTTDGAKGLGKHKTKTQINFFLVLFYFVFQFPLFSSNNGLSSSV